MKDFVIIKKTYDQVFFSASAYINILASKTNEVIAEIHCFKDLLNCLLEICIGDEINNPSYNSLYKLQFMKSNNTENLIFQVLFDELSTKPNTAREILNYFKFTTELQFIVEIHVDSNIPELDSIQDKNNLKEYFSHIDYLNRRVYRIKTPSELLKTWFCSNELYRISDAQFFFYSYELVKYSEYTECQGCYETYSDYLAEQEEAA